MKTFFLSLAIACVLILGGLLFNSGMNRVSDALTAQNQKTLSDVMAQDFGLASEDADEMREFLDRKYTLLASVVDHDIIDDIELCLSELSGYTRSRNGTEAQVRCLRLEKLIARLRTNYSVTLQNIL